MDSVMRDIPLRPLQSPGATAAATVRRALLCGVVSLVLLAFDCRQCRQYTVLLGLGFYARDSTMTGINVTTSNETLVGSRRRIAFVPFPHRPLVSGEDAQCRWTTEYHADGAAGAVPHRPLDPIQLAAYSEGVCVPDRLKSTLHVFSTAEAVECLNSTAQGRSISVTVSGDSYTRQLFIGLADVLLGRPSDEQITTYKKRLGLLAESNERLAHLRGNDTSFPDVQYPMECFGECYGDYSDATAPFSVRCSRCVNNFTSRSEDAVGVVGAGVHNLRYFGHRVRERARKNGEEAASAAIPLVARDEASGETAESVNETIRDLERFLDLANRTIYVSMPSYQVEKVPLPYQNATHNTHAGRIYDGLLPSLAPREPGHPFLDYFQLTKACHMNNCSYDGGHRSRYVNRWKAQLLLNTLCEVRDGWESRAG